MKKTHVAPIIPHTLNIQETGNYNMRITLELQKDISIKQTLYTSIIKQKKMYYITFYIFLFL